MRRAAWLVLLVFLSWAPLSGQAAPGSISPEDRTKLELLLREGSTLLPSLKANFAYRERQIESRRARIVERESALTQSESDLAARQSALEQRESDLATRELNLIEREKSQDKIEQALIDSRISFETASLSLKAQALELWITRGAAVLGVGAALYFALWD
jgi:uncharacterized protein (DUF3084 family)